MKHFCSRLYRTFRVLPIAMLLVVCILPQQSYACAIKSTSIHMAADGSALSTGKLFFGHHKNKFTVQVLTDGASDCTDSKKYGTVYMWLFNKSGKNPTKPLENVNALPVVMSKPEGLTQRFYLSEEACYDQRPEDLKTIIDKINSGRGDVDKITRKTFTDRGVDYPSDTDAGLLWDFVFSNKKDGLSNPGVYLKAKSLLYNFSTYSGIVGGDFPDCGLFARASFVQSLATTDGGANIQSKDYPQTGSGANYLGYICNPTDGFKNDADFTYYFKNEFDPKKIFQGDSIDTEMKKENQVSNFCQDSPTDVAKSISQDESVVYESETCKNNSGAGASGEIPDCYELLAPVPGFTDTIYFEGGPDGSKGVFSIIQLFNSLMTILFGAVSVIAVIMLIYIGGQYVVSGSSGATAAVASAKKRLKGVAIGIVVLLSSYLILTTINPRLVNFEAKLENAVLDQYSAAQSAAIILRATQLAPDAKAFCADKQKANGYSACGIGTDFGYKDSLDAGCGSPALNPTKSSKGVNTNNTKIRGASLPQPVLEAMFGKVNWEKWDAARRAAVRVVGPKGVDIVPLVDIGPNRADILAKGVVIDQTTALDWLVGCGSKTVGTGNCNGPRAYQILPDYYDGSTPQKTRPPVEQCPK